MSETPVPTAASTDPPAPPPVAGEPRGGRLATAGRRLPLGLALGGLVGLVVKDLDLAALTSFGGSREVLAVLIALGIGVGWAAGLRRLIAVLVGGSMALWAIVAFSPLCPALAAGLVRSEAVEPADAVFVSFAALSPGELAHAEERSRVLHAVELVARGKAPLLVVPEKDAGRASDVAEVMQILGVGREKLLVLPAGHNTHEEALALGQLFHERKWRLVVAVTSPLHSSRAGACLAREDVRVLLSPSLETRFDVSDLRRAADRIGAFGSVIHEQMGRFVYRLRGWA
jgi:uncharacterized SAM-binding protein YcdF (DUF218 family)